MERAARKLYVLKTSPWSERAKWALDHHGLGFETIDHTPMLGELRLRRVAGGPGKKRVTTPVLVDEGRVLTDSWDIALYADEVGKGSKLVPAERESEVRRWNDAAEEAMRAGRTLLIPRLRQSGEALDSILPPVFPTWVRPALRPITRYATTWFSRKYDLRFDEAAELAKMRSALENLRAALAKSSPYLLGAFSYADIVMAIVLQGVRPVDDRYFPLDPAMRVVWTREDFVADYGDLLAWRDLLYERHRFGIAGQQP
jgi:glutathione S-transferase